MTGNLDYQLLDKLLDRVKTKVFLGNHSAFYGSLLCSLNFHWSEDIETACVNGLSIEWNPHFFLALPEATRSSVLMHELRHIAYLDVPRRGSREPEEWNWAVDLVINNELDYEGYTWKGVKPWLDHKYDGMIAEEIYEDLIANPPNGKFNTVWGHESPTGQSDYGDLVEATDQSAANNQITQITNAVVAAGHAAKMAGEGGIAAIEELLNRFLNPKIPWETLLHRWMGDLLEQDYSWRRPNRRHQEMYLPCLIDDDGRLEHLIYYQDVSGSVGKKEITRVLSEIKYVKEFYNPKKLTLVLFDEAITAEYEFNEEDDFNEVMIIGRRGTSLVPVREHILKHKPTAAIVFSDMVCEPMEKLPEEIPILWIGVNATRSHKINMGQIIYINE